MSSLRYSIPSIDHLRDEAEKKFGHKPCLFQARDAIVQLERKQHCITIARTGLGKTLTFWLPLLFNGGGIKIVVTALIVLGEQNLRELQEIGIPAVNLTGETATDEVYRNIAAGRYQVIIVSPEMILNDSRFTNLWDTKTFTSRLFNISFDEGHCITEWGKKFRPAYADLERLVWRVPRDLRFHVVSATMPADVLADVKTTLRMQEALTTTIRRSNDRSNIHLIVVEMEHPANSFIDIERVLQTYKWKDNPERPPPFMIFSNRRRETEIGTEKVQEGLPAWLQGKVVWFHSGMSTEFREDAIERFRTGEIWGGFYTDAGGMGLDLPNVELVIQYRYVESLSTLVQRFGRGGRAQGTEARAIYLVEPQHFDHKKAEAEWRILKAKRKRTAGDGDGGRPGAKKQKKSKSARVTISDGDVTPIPDVALGDLSDDAEAQFLSSFLARQPKALPSRKGLALEEYERLVMDLFINSQSRGVCRRCVINDYFGNNAPDIDRLPCCERCKNKISRLCCDFCNSTSFTLPPLPTDEKAKQAKSKRKFNEKNPKMTTVDEGLFNEIHEWRTLTAPTLTDGRSNAWFGPQHLLSDAKLDRIVMLARNQKIPNLTALCEQVPAWRHVGTYGEEVLAIAHRFYPLPPPAEKSKPPTVVLGPTAATQAAEDENANVGGKTTGKKRNCTACGSDKHISSLQLCPARVAEGSENVPPSSKRNTRKGNTQCKACKQLGHNSRNKLCPNYGKKDNMAQIETK